ncbi:putative vacuolar protein sorting protein 16 [Leptomonas pyrrhocoris]|uniref:Putative vacuolar protein sorting protein 16 n=1 Tax=Leptomonas pyrrhocoris TaxID=157538 RepID=A0A0M9G2R9_LEPPY|nr:putative vacuolar protein sorting protein 16 [Leptomonas pyrrhocoris]KPA80979.1 putative vacuolar protein sorting protein 16 [Leptomonas pyrrhocoris]|eukprot:XP_015659418.1 putative vacuolar protein sorting protein 16 [Leptomonas pyrrhocoris]
MVDRVGEWYAFSRTDFCRRLTLYEHLQWRSPLALDPAEAAGRAEAELPPSFSLATAELVAVAPFGGPIAVLIHAADFTASSPSVTVGSSSLPLSFSSDAPTRPYFNLSAHSAATAASRAIHVFTNAGELLASFPLTPQDVGHDAIKTLGWTPEGELFCLLEPSLVVLFVDMRDVAVESSAASSTIISRRVSLRHQTEVAAPPTLPSASSAAPIEALCVSAEGLLCVDGDGSGQLHGLLHEEKFRSTRVPPVRLPLHTPSLRTAGEAGGLGQAASEAVSRPRVTAVEMVPPAWNDSGDFVVLWAQHDDMFPEKKVHEGGKAKVKAEEGEVEVMSTLCAMVLPDGDVLDYYASGMVAATAPTPAPSLASTWPAARIACPGRVLNLSVCLNDPTRVAAFTSLGVLHVLRSNLSCVLYSLDVGLCRVLRDRAVTAAHTSGGGGDGGGALSSNSFAFGDAPWRQSDIDGPSNASVAGGNTGTSFSSSFSSMVGAHGGGVGYRGSAVESAVACLASYKLEWCGANFVLLHGYQSDFQQPYSGGTTSGPSVARQEAPMFSLLVCAQKDCSVRCERLDWSLDGSGHIVTVAEVDGVRVVSDTACYILQEVPSCLAKLCRVQPPFSAAAQVVLAYEAYMNGDRHGIAQVRVALSFSASTNASVTDTTAAVAQASEVDNEEDDLADDEGEMSYAEGIVYELLDAASCELDVQQQYLLVAAASFAGETIRLRSGVPDVIVDVVRRLRVLRAVREEARCHTPLTMGQYQALNGSEERPARLLSSSEGSVLVDRLAYLGYYQLALDVVRALHMKLNRVLSRWASSFVRRHAALLSDTALHHEVAQVLRQYPSASYVGPATTAFHLGRRDVALRLLRDEPQQQRQRVLLLAKMGELTMAGRAAASSGSAELIHLVVSALVAREAQTQRGHASSSGGGEGGGGDQGPQGEGDGAANVAAEGVTAGDVYHCLIASPELLCWLLVGAQCLVSWQSMAQRLLFSHHWSLASLECQHLLVQCLRRTSVMHRRQLQRLMEDTAAGGSPRRTPRTAELGTQKERDEGSDAQRKSKKEKKREKKKKTQPHHKKDGSGGDSGESGNEEDSVNGDEDQGAATGPTAAVALPPPLGIPVATAVDVAAALTEWTKKTSGMLFSGLEHAEELRREKSTARYPFSVILDSGAQLRADMRKAATQGSDDRDQSASRRKRSPAAHLAGEEEGSRDVDAASSSSVLAHEQMVRTNLSIPSTMPHHAIAALKQEQALCQLKVRLAVKYNTPRLSYAVSVRDLIYELCGVEDSEADAAEVQRAFKVHDKIYFYAKLRGLCAAQRWDAVDRFLGPAPPLRKRSFFSVAEGGSARTPCVGYLAVVQLLMEYGQEERAARYVAGACSEAVDRVVLYMSLGAPVMALEAAMVDKDAGLIQQIMQRVPASAKVQSVGTQMLNDLRED